MPRPSYRRPPWWMRMIGNRIAPVMNRTMVARLSVPGRSSGQWRTTPIVVLDDQGERYLLAPGGHTDWARNLRAAGHGRLIQHGRVEEFAAVEVPPHQRPALITAYQHRYGKMPTVAASFRQFPDPVDHPTFRITPPRNG
jgi:deazaflavin-dependent oxidoreductase (nitroreductase family)